jgi:hypothetical protein
VNPPAATAPDLGVAVGSTTTATLAWFLAAPRTMAGRRCRSARALVRLGARGDRLRERVEVHDHQVEGRDAELVELGDVVLEPPVGEQARVRPPVAASWTPAASLSRAPV